MLKAIENIKIQILSAIVACRQSGKPNIARLAREFGVPYGRLRYRINGRKANSTFTTE
ncbi:DNA binding HTH domain, Psq-type [Penicillium expansum]|uniref:DNA binding HTH domain, Psq-type n=1 Tax=Penicillium expansum TaxID=27334 RepID=A0A0A2IHC4_PENEN|nr:DNA binding HTH domain, Psq-type [Penicillium expansum]KGO41838.1 DNA binding HTH domain, Psq-type [Penicillium expansum]KGO49974.1 DNA binding HTH domain, Psq-type [Penicillium expansum]KGO51167.1 DNA binding HTH domain, Psq-type [Penicillium expansum]